MRTPLMFKGDGGRGFQSTKEWRPFPVCLTLISFREFSSESTCFTWLLYYVIYASTLKYNSHEANVFFFFLLSSSLGIKNDPKLPIYFYFFWLKTSRGCWFSLVEDLCGFINDLTSLVINYGRQEGCSFSQLKQCGSVSRYNSPR